MPADPAILVKKTDGTFVKVPLSELKKKTTVSPPYGEGARGGVFRASPPHKKPEPVAMAKPIEVKTVKINHQPKPKPKGWSREDSKSLLEEKPSVKLPAASPLSDSRTGQVEAVMKKLDFPVPEIFKNRLRGVVQLKLKDIKSEDEAREILLKSIKDGGLGFTEQQADKIIKLCADAVDSSGATEEPVMVFKKSLRDMAPASAKAMAGRPAAAKAAPDESEIPANFTPFNAFVHGDSRGGAVSPPARGGALGGGGSNAVVSKILGNEIAAEPVFKIDTQKIKKPVNDIMAPPVSFGPVEEIKYFSLLDFRRLSSDPKESARRLLQKFLNLKDESYLLYLDAKSAHYQSPIYKDYFSVISQSLSNRQTLANTCSQKGGMNLAELNAIIEMEKEL